MDLISLTILLLPTINKMKPHFHLALLFLKESSRAGDGIPLVHSDFPLREEENINKLWKHFHTIQNKIFKIFRALTKYQVLYLAFHMLSDLNPIF